MKIFMYKVLRLISFIIGILATLLGLVAMPATLVLTVFGIFLIYLSFTLKSYTVKPKKIEQKKEINSNDSKNNKANEISLSTTKEEKAPAKPWIISVSFGESSSKNFNRALFLGEQSDYFSNYTTDDGTKVYQADFNKDNFLNYLDLYRLVSNWKSSFVFINGKRVNKKELSTINRCYGDKISFNDSHFCFGASMHTENPFGCHRLMITPSQRDWKSYSVRKGNYLIIDKPAIAKEIINQSKHVENCPSFNLEKSLNAVLKLPEKIKINTDFLNY